MKVNVVTFKATAHKILKEALNRKEKDREAEKLGIIKGAALLLFFRIRTHGQLGRKLFLMF